MFSIIEAGKGKFIKAWNRGVPFEEKAVEQLKQTARLPFVAPYVAAMPDTHWGLGATVGSVVPTEGAVCPAAVGVDIGCGMIAVRLKLMREELPENLSELRVDIERAVPCGRTHHAGEGDVGAWSSRAIPEHVQRIWKEQFSEPYKKLCSDHPGARSRNAERHPGTLGTGNHFLELTTDEEGLVWLVIHSGSRGLGNRIGTYFTKLAKEICKKRRVELPNADLAYLTESSSEFDDYIGALHLAQKFAWQSRLLMADAALGALSAHASVEEIDRVHCHHNYMAEEHHYGKDVLLTRKGAVRAAVGDIGIIPGSMGARSFIVRGKGCRDSFQSCSHGAGRAMSRTEAKRRFSVADHVAATQGVECDKTTAVIDETPGAYKSIEAVMAAQEDLVEVVHTLKQFLCVKGLGE
jgi:tRNA-splicing ligase RtcB